MIGSAAAGRQQLVAADPARLQRRRQQRGWVWQRPPTAQLEQQGGSCRSSKSDPQQATSSSSQQSSSSSQQVQHQQQPLALPRRALLAAAAGVAALTAGGSAGPAIASKLPEAVDKAWAGLGGGPADLVFPENFLGAWDVDSVLTNIELPLGPEFVPDMRVVQRAQQEDLNSVIKYQVAFTQNQRGEVVPDRSFNTASLMQTYTGTAAAEVQQRIDWDLNDPNLLEMALPGGMQISTRVTRRSEEQQGSDRLATSEYFQQLISSPQRPQPKVKASQCYTKYHWRSEAAAGAGGGGGVQIVATQVVSDYLTSFDDPMMMMQAKGSPIVVYTYRMSFRRRLTSQIAAAALVDDRAAV